MKYQFDFIESWHSLPYKIRLFVKRAFLLMLVWKLVYLFVLLPGRVIDKPLTRASINGAAALMQVCNPSARISISEEWKPAANAAETGHMMDYIRVNGQKVVGIADGCNALELYVLFLGFIISYPNRSKRKINFSFIGVLTIYGCNCLRLDALAWLNGHTVEVTDFAHQYLIQIGMYALIFAIWLQYTRRKRVRLYAV